jgi:hypothetical protein
VYPLSVREGQTDESFEVLTRHVGRTKGDANEH